MVGVVSPGEAAVIVPNVFPGHQPGAVGENYIVFGKTFLSHGS